MRVLIAPDKFKGSMTAAQAAEAIALGVRDAFEHERRRGEADICPIADGGDGTLEVIARATPGAGRPRATTAHPLPGHDAGVPYLVFPGIDDEPTALIESALIVGLARVPQQHRDPEVLRTHGIGEVVRHAVSSGCRRVIVTLGGSATIDGGVGLAQELGVRFTSAGRPIPDISGKDLGRIDAINTDRSDDEFGDIDFIGLCDVDSPLLGPAGAARLYGPQKGATPQQVRRLESGLANLARVCRESGLPVDPEAEGAGAAGGLGFGLMALFSAELYSGAASVLETVLFEQRCATADLIITGEGQFDTQTMQGKAVGHVVDGARRAGKRVMVVCGHADPAIVGTVGDRTGPWLDPDDVCSLTSLAPTPDEAMAHAPELARQAARRLVSRWLSEDRTPARRGGDAGSRPPRYP